MKRDSYTYSVILTPEPEGGYTVTVPALPEVITYGETVEDALKYAKECIELCVECRIDEGLEVPREIAPIATSIVTGFPSSARYAQAV